MPRETVIEELKDGVLLVTLNRPRQLNAFNRAMWWDAGDALGDARSADEVRVVVITGAEGAFTAGQDLREMGRSSEAQGEEGFLRDQVRHRGDRMVMRAGRPRRRDPRRWTRSKHRTPRATRAEPDPPRTACSVAPPLNGRPC